MEDSPKTYTVNQTAYMLGISRGTAYQRIAEGEIPSIRLGRRVLVPRAALDAWLLKAVA